MINIVINGKHIRLERPVTVLDAAAMNGIKIPHLCSHPLLERWGGCRMCFVEVEKMPHLQTACTLMAAEGISVITESEEISRVRKAMLEFHLINHPLECPTCDKAGECKLQDYAMQYGAAESRFRERKLRFPESVEDPLIVRNMQRCIRCTRCVRMCGSVQGASAIAMVGKGARTRMEPFSSDGRFDCEYCGNCLTVCPVGSIMSRLHRHTYRPWQMDRTVETICPYCGVGCKMQAEVREEGIVRTMPLASLGVNRGLLCARGRFGYDYIMSPERLTTPLIRKNGELTPATWDEALDTVAGRLLEISKTHGGPSVAAIGSARCTNEENYLLQKLMRTALGTNNIDSIARLGYAGAQRELEGMLGQGVTANPIHGILNTDLILTVGGDPTRMNPILGVLIRRAYLKGVKVVTVGRTPGLVNHRTLGIMPHPLREGVFLRGAVSGIIQRRTLTGENEKLENEIKGLRLPTPEEASAASGLTGNEVERLIDALVRTTSVCVVIGEGAAVRPDTVALLGILSYVLNGRIYLMSTRPNEQGAMDMGCLPDELPGGRPLELESFRKRYGDLWGAEVPKESGLTLMEMIEGAQQGKVRAMYVMGENPAMNLPDASRAVEALKKLDFLAVQDIFMSETAELADVVLPALGWAEKEGTFTNMERRIQHTAKAVNRDSMDDLHILAALGRRMGADMPRMSAAEVMDEIAEVSPLHTGLSYKEIKGAGNLWPYRTGKPLTGGFEFTGLDGGYDASYSDGSLVAIPDIPLFHSGTTSRHSRALTSIGPAAEAAMHPETASALGLKDGDKVRFSTQAGAVVATLKVESETHPQAVYLSGNEKSAGVLNIFMYTIVRHTKAPLPGANNIKVEKAKE